MPNIYTGATGQPPGPAYTSDRAADNARSAFTGANLIKLRSAFHHVETKCLTKTCDDAFLVLSAKRSFRDVWRDPSIWVYFLDSYIRRDEKNDPHLTMAFMIENKIVLTSLTMGGHRYGELQQDSQGKLKVQLDVGFGMRAIAANLIHELAHVAGAPRTTAQAEGVLKSCMFSDLAMEGHAG